MTDFLSFWDWRAYLPKSYLKFLFFHIGNIYNFGTPYHAVSQKYP